MRTLPGRSFPLGATVDPDGVNFCVFSKNCDAIDLLLFDHADALRPSHTLRLDPRLNRTFYYWHIFIPGLKDGQVYAYRAHGPFEPETGLRFDGRKVLLDPYARAVAMGRYERGAAVRPGDNCAHAPRGIVVDPTRYDWEDDLPLSRPFSTSVIYELHVGGFTRHPNSGLPAHQRGTYAGLIEKIPYLQSLGITAVELLPIQQFDAQDAPQGHLNYWGYAPLAFFAPHAAYSSRGDPLGPVYEFRDMVKALHRAGIEVILDVVFNHTCEGDHRGPTLSFRGLENRAYYILEDNRAYYANYTGCGNSLNGNQSIVRRLIIDCLRHWVAEMHVDGFRFDLASVMARDEWGQPLRSPPILWEIESDPVLAGTKLIAEAWDAGGLYQVGTFIGHRWAEWNGRFRDDVRRFVKGDPGTVAPLAARLLASTDVYRQPDRDPNRSVNFITCHDGFTLNDLVSCNHKHNEANGDANRDGTDANYSWNCGVEGPSDDPAVERLRQQQIRNFLTLLFIAQGTPMLLMGDELRRTQNGNNNAYCHDNELSWMDWSALKRQAGLLRFVTGLIRFTQTHELFRQESPWLPPDGAHRPLLTWHGVHLNQPDWSADSHSLAFSLHLDGRQNVIHILLNAYWEPLSFDLPRLPRGRHWYRIIDTARPAPDDFVEPDRAPPVTEESYLAAARSSVLFLSG
jgi:glycogen operon protein